MSDRPAWINVVLAKASKKLLEFEESGIFPSELRVHHDIYLSFSELRRRELDRGIPLMVLGILVVEDTRVDRDSFALTP